MLFLWASISLPNGLPASCILQLLCFILQVIALEMDLILWLSSSESFHTLHHTNSLQKLVYPSLLPPPCMAQALGALCLQNSHAIRCSSVCSVSCLRDRVFPFPPPFLPHYYYSKPCLSFKSQFKREQFFKAFQGAPT